MIPWLIAILSTLVQRRDRSVFAYLSWLLLALIAVSFPLGGDFNSIIERGEYELSAFKDGENKDYILFAVAYISSALGIETPQGYSLIILLVLLKLRKNFGILFLILNLVYFAYLGITGYHRNYLSLLLLIWGFIGGNLVLILISILTHKAAFFYLLILLFSKVFSKIIYFKSKNLISFFNISLVITLMLLLTYIIAINYNNIGPFKHYFEHYIEYEADKSQGAYLRYFSSLSTVFLFYVYYKKQRRKYFFNKTFSRQKETIELSMWLCLILAFTLLNLGFSIAPDRITLFSLILFSLLLSQIDNNTRSEKPHLIIVLPIFISTVVWLLISDKAYYLWGGQNFMKFFE